MSPRTTTRPPADPFTAILAQSARMARATSAAVIERPATVEVSTEIPNWRPMPTRRDITKGRVFTPCDLCGDELCSGCVLPDGATYPCARCRVNTTVLPDTWCLPCVRAAREGRMAGTTKGASQGSDR